MEADPRDVIKRHIRGGKLDAEDPVGKAVQVHDYIAHGGESYVYKARLVYGELGEEGWRGLALPILTHDEIKHNSGHVSHWNEARKRAAEKLDEMSKTSVEGLVKTFYEQWGLLKGRNEVALRITRYSKKELPRLGRQKYVTGMHHPNLAHIFMFGDLRYRPEGRKEEKAEYGLNQLNPYDDLSEPKEEQVYEPTPEEMRNMRHAYSLVELLDGSPGSSTTQSWSIDQQIKLMKHVTRGLKFLNTFGVLHRDIKPANILYKVIETNGKKVMVLDKEAFKITDYGFMKPNVAGPSSFKTRDGAFFGTTYFMSPEQVIDSGKVGWESDQYSMGGTFYAIMTGRMPVKLEPGTAPTHLSVANTIDRHAFKLDSIVSRPDMKREGLQMIIARMMQKDPRDRYPNYDELMTDLDRVSFGKLPVNVNYSHAQSLFEKSKHDDHFTHRKERMRRNVLLGAGALGIAGAAAYKLGYLDELISAIGKLF